MRHDSDAIRSGDVFISRVDVRQGRNPEICYIVTQVDPDPHSARVIALSRGRVLAVFVHGNWLMRDTWRSEGYECILAC